MFTSFTGRSGHGRAETVRARGTCPLALFAQYTRRYDPASPPFPPEADMAALEDSDVVIVEAVRSPLGKRNTASPLPTPPISSVPSRWLRSIAAA